MDDDNRWLETMVRVGCELVVFVADVLGLLQLVVVCTGVGAFNSTTVVVKFTVLAAHFRIRLLPTHRPLVSARVFVGLVLLIGEANCVRVGQLEAIGTRSAPLESAAIRVGGTV